MEVLVAPVEEEQVLRHVDAETPAAEIQDALVQQAQCCVDHLCGCATDATSAD